MSLPDVSSPELRPNPRSEAYQFLTPLEFVREKSKVKVADKVISLALDKNFRSSGFKKSNGFQN